MIHGPVVALDGVVCFTASYWAKPNAKHLLALTLNHRHMKSYSSLKGEGLRLRELKSFADSLFNWSTELGLEPKPVDSPALPPGLGPRGIPEQGALGRAGVHASALLVKLLWGGLQGPGEIPAPGGCEEGSPGRLNTTQAGLLLAQGCELGLG